MKKLLCIFVAVLACCALTTAVMASETSVVVCTGENQEAYATLEEAIGKVGDGYIKLTQPITEDVTVSKDLYLDLNGNTITGTVTVTEGAVLYGMDSQTDDFTVEDTEGYGKLTVAGKGEVKGLPEESAFAEFGYLKVEEKDGISFHAVDLRLTAMSLRSESTGVYYKSKFAGDELVAEQVLEYGVALSASTIPTEKTMDVYCKRSVLKNFKAGGMDEDATSTLLKDILLEKNSTSTNQRYAKIPIYGRAYILTEDGFMFGAYAKRSFKEQVEMVDEKLETIEQDKQTAFMTMYETFRQVLRQWDVPNVIARHTSKTNEDDGVLKILGIGNSYTSDSMRMLDAVYKAEKPGTKLQLGYAYYSGCPLDKHVKFYNQNSAVYVYYYLDSETGTWQEEEDVTLQYIIQANNWDYVSLQQGSGLSGVASSYNEDIQTIQNFVDDDLGYTPTFFWNMTWAYPEVDPKGTYLLGNNYVAGGAKAPNADSFKNYYNNSQAYMYQKITETVQAKIVPNKTFKWIMPAGTAVQNAQSSYLTDVDLYRDYTHMNDFGRLMVAYVWYSRLENTVPTFALTSVPEGLKNADPVNNWNWSEDMINVLKESVINALETPFAITQSQYTK